MIYLKQNEELYNNDIRVMLQAFFDNEKIVLTEENTRLMLDVEYTADVDVETGVRTGGYVTFLLEDENGYRQSKTVVVDFLNKRAARNPLKAALYRMLSAYTGKELPWGSLTGVRPTKIATELLEHGETEENIHKVYTDTYLTIPQKADICIEVAKKEQELLRDFRYPEEYCLYIGIPFCPTRCLYCSFTSYPITVYRDRVEDYLQALYREMEFTAENEAYKKKKLSAVYIGGGTPSALTAEQLEELITRLIRSFDMSGVREFCVECGRPDSITMEKLERLKALGVQRISINPQTMSEDTLKLIGRAHSVEQTKEAFMLARKAGFTNINMDMIVGLPGEDIRNVRHTLSEIQKLHPDSLTVHSLAIKRAADLNIEMERYRKLVKGSTNEMLLAADTCAREMGMLPYYLYRQKNIPGKLENIGYAAPGKECLYNILIMEEKLDILALGAGASSKFIFYGENRIERVQNVKNVEEYITRIDEMIERKRRMFA
ncbi:MAG: coproporphyrinogen dehydrogenase HemZ [Bacteroidales bacterium]|nr:coproporphyrinogen dehydrogenase HemZ [Clostridium sp.]MCM1203438.1 coproporphyrinogen dehydrogenase HemZ [Bacteroidales bacterium]